MNKERETAMAKARGVAERFRQHWPLLTPERIDNLAAEMRQVLGQ